MRYKKNINKILNNLIWVTGCARSGTTILGKILSTLKNVEYGYEPEFLFGLLPKIHKLHKQDWLDIYNTYIVEELFFNLCTGRKVNYKKNEDSYIGHSINSEDIKKKLNIEIRRIDFEEYLKKNKKQLIIKIPDVSKNLTILEKYYPKNKFIITKRNSESICASILKKNWFKRNESLPWIYNNPELFGENIYKKWIKLNEKKKAEIYIKEMNKNCKKIKNKYIFVYENLMKDPNKEINKICKFLNLKKTIKTKEIIKTVRKISSTR